MAVRYIQVKPISELFSPAVRAFGNIAIVGNAPVGPTNTPWLFTNPDDAKAQFAPSDVTLPKGDLYNAIERAFLQTPGPSVVYGVRTAATPDWAASLATLNTLDVQLVVLANTPLSTTNATGAIAELVKHVTGVSNTGEDGRERMGVAMLEKGSKNAALVAGALADERMVYIAHNSDQDAAAAVAGTIAGYESHISLLLKPVHIDSNPFTPAEIDTINGTENFGDPPKGQGVNWLTSPVLIPGGGVYMGEGYTGNPGGGKKFIDIVRTIDDVSFRLKARLINAIGNLRISRSGLRSLIAQMEAVLNPLVSNEVIESYEFVLPLLALLDKNPDSLTPAQIQQIQDAQAQRLVQVLVAVEYAGAIHRLAITLKFE